MELKFELINKKRAKELLSTMVLNRSIKKVNFDKLVSAMRNGEFDSENGELIKINKNGKVVDGQHRLMAVIEADVSITMAIAYGCSNDAIKTIDTGATRSIADVLKLSNVKSYTKVPFVIQCESVIFKNKTIRFTSAHSEYKTAHSILDIYNENKEEIDETVRVASNFYNKFRLLTPSIIVAYYNVFNKIDSDACDDFFTQLSSYKIYDSPIILLRDKLTKDKITSLKKLSSPEKEALFIKAWNYYMKGQEVKILRWQPTTEDFPRVYGLENISDKMF